MSSETTESQFIYRVRLLQLSHYTSIHYTSILPKFVFLQLSHCASTLSHFVTVHPHCLTLYCYNWVTVHLYCSTSSCYNWVLCIYTALFRIVTIKSLHISIARLRT
jgi:hypothetical protein